MEENQTFDLSKEKNIKIESSPMPSERKINNQQQHTEIKKNKEKID